MILLLFIRMNTGALGYNGPICLEFWYYMYGENIPENALQIYIKNDAEDGTELYQWSRSYNQGQHWLRYRESIFGISQDMTVSNKYIKSFA